MKLKKNLDKDLNRKRGLYFVLGLLLLLMLIYLALEWKTEDDHKGYDIGLFPKTEVNSNYSKVILTTKSKTTVPFNVDNSIYLR